MVDQVILHRVKEPCYVGGLTRRGLALVIEGIACEASSHPCVMSSRDVEGGGLLADGQTWCSQYTWGSAVTE
jgi:hypothetical protein